jgi:GGDEF domain-containing protein
MTLEQRVGVARTLELDRVGALDEGESLTEILSAGLVRHDDDHAFERTDARPRQETSLREALLQRADTAMYAAKRRTRAEYAAV